MDMIRHHDKRNELVQGSDVIPMPNGLRNAFSDPRLFEPSGAKRCALKFTVGDNESAPIPPGRQRERTVQSKCNE
jgi:hypothetical protein